MKLKKEQSEVLCNHGSDDVMACSCSEDEEKVNEVSFIFDNNLVIV